MRITDFDLYKDLLKEHSGLVLTPDKSYLLDSRLSSIAKKWGYPSLDAMTITLQAVPDKNLVIDVVEAMTSNETSFFRDIRPFNTFKDTILPYLIKNRASKRQLKIWCAGAASGQEPYSLAMLLQENEDKMAGWKIDILATDISNEVLSQARQGVYSQFEVQRGVPIRTLIKHFIQNDEKWEIHENLKKMVRFQHFNLLHNMTSLGRFDVIFCRNVLSDFDDETKSRTLTGMEKQLEKDGVLFLGAKETLPETGQSFKAVADKRGLYAPKDSPHHKTAL